MVGTITPYKQPLEFLQFLRAWRHQASFPIKKCSWVGQADPTHPYARQFLEELSVARSQGWAEHFQELSPSVLIQKMDESDALVHLPTEEAFGLVVAEAMIRGLPIIAAKTGGLPDFASYYQKIRLVPNQPCSEWEEALSSQFLRDARVPLDSWPSHVYKPQDVASKHLEIYREVIASR
jgi:glycosyltransferase involved in cell wall biosynthesis